jgi:ABC-type uncharacterized transport system permease subunit
MSKNETVLTISALYVIIASILCFRFAEPTGWLAVLLIIVLGALGAVAAAIPIGTLTHWFMRWCALHIEHREGMKHD